MLHSSLEGLSEPSVDAVWQRLSTLELLLEKPQGELRQLIQIDGSNIEENEIIRWQRAMYNLKRCHHSMMIEDKTEYSDLSWTFCREQQLPDNSVRGIESDQSPQPPTPFKKDFSFIAHRFTKKFRALSTCDYCNKQMFFGLKCVECKYSCHKDCEASVPPTCGVPPEFMYEFKQTFNLESTSHLPLQMPDITEAGNGFFFSRGRPDPKKVLNDTTNGNRVHQHKVDSLRDYFNEISNTNFSNERKSSIINVEEREPCKSVILEVVAHPISSSPSANSVNESVSDEEHNKSEWGVQYDDIKILDKIGVGRFGTVHRGQWYGDVAVKLLNANYLDDKQSLKAFQDEIATYKNTRHENLVLFMGFCTEPQAIITSLCKGNTLATHIHSRRDRFSLQKAANVAQQISNGMGYLHAKGIIHKDLTTKNIFLENLRVVITDFGLFSATKMQYNNNGLFIPKNWLCYLAPELMRSLKRSHEHKAELEFSRASDVYAFGTIWYELLCGEFPFKNLPPDSIIYLIGCGIKQTLANIQATREIKDILMISWAFQANDRPDFGRLFQLLKELPKKQMPKTRTRLHLSLSAESVF